MFNAATLICFEKYGLSMWILSISRLRGAAHFLTKRCWRKRPGLSKPWMRIEGKHCNPQHMDRSLCIFDRNLSQLSRSQYLLSTKKIANVSGKKRQTKLKPIMNHWINMDKYKWIYSDSEYSGLKYKLCHHGMAFKFTQLFKNPWYVHSFEVFRPQLYSQPQTWNPCFVASPKVFETCPWQHLTTTSVFHFLSRARKLQSSHAGKCPSRPPRLWELQSLQSLLGPEGVWCRIPGLCRLGESRDQKYSEIRFGGSEMTWRCHLLELLWDRLASHATHVTCFVMSLGKCSLALAF